MSGSLINASIISREQATYFGSYDTDFKGCLLASYFQANVLIARTSHLNPYKMSDLVRPASPSTKSGASTTAVARPPGANAVRRRAPTAPKPNSTRAAGAGGSSNTMLKLYTDSGENGLQVDPYVVIVLALVFIASIFFLHITARIFKALTS